jgi:hypothetical protein
MGVVTLIRNRRIEGTDDFTCGLRQWEERRVIRSFEIGVVLIGSIGSSVLLSHARALRYGGVDYAAESFRSLMDSGRMSTC